MIRKRISEPFDVVCVGDPALQAVDYAAMREYSMTRDVACLEIDKLPEKPTVFTCAPLLCEHEHVLGNMDHAAMWFLFSRYVTKIKNSDFDVDLKYVTERDKTRISDDCRKLFPIDVVAEIASVIIERASGRDGENIPFSQPDGSWFRNWIASKTLSALKSKPV
jgi:hypothetical protein